MKTFLSLCDRHARRIELCLIAVFIAYFIAQGIYFITTIPHTVSPDSTFHLRQIISFYLSPGIMHNPPTNIPWYSYSIQQANIGFLYHFFFGKLALLGDFFKEVNFIRSANLLFSSIYLLYFYKLTKLFFKSSLLRVVAFIAQSTLLMFVFLSANISYDNLANLMCIISIYFTVKGVQERNLIHFIKALIFIALGCLIKITILPLAGIIFGVIAWNCYSEKLCKTKSLKKLNTQNNKLLLGTFIIIALTNVAFHGQNLISYHSLIPKCDKILSHEECYNSHPVYHKYYDIKQEIYTLNETPNTFKDVGPFKYASRWLDLITEKILGIYAYSSFYQSGFILDAFQLIIFAGFLCAIRFFQTKDKTTNLALIIAGIYTLTILLLSYKGFTKSHWMPRYEFAGVQGRYIFPVISLWIILLMHYLISFWKKNTQIVIATIVSLFLILASFPTYLMAGDKEPLTPNKDINPYYFIETRK